MTVSATTSLSQLPQSQTPAFNNRGSWPAILSALHLLAKPLLGRRMLDVDRFWTQAQLFEED
jgi:hypothetical protein